MNHDEAFNAILALAVFGFLSILFIRLLLL